MKPTLKTGSVRVRLDTERVPGLIFARDERAAMPRKPGGGLDYLRVKSGVPEPIRSRLGKNLFISAFPYPQWLESGGRVEPRDFRVVRLENDRWRVTVCPDLGGRILGLFDRRLGRELLWQPTAFQFASIGLPGAWLLGGIEFNAFRFGHCVHGMMALRTERVELAGGGIGLRWGAVDELVESEWSVTLALRDNCVAVRVELKNHSDHPQPGYWWTNIAVPAQQGTRLLYHPGPVLHHGCEMGMQHETWPALQRADWQHWQNHTGIISAYWPEYQSDLFGYAAPGEGWALAHHGPRAVCRGRKLWSVGANHDADIWMDRVGDPCAESYCEIQSGRLPTQLETDLIPPKSGIDWVERVGTVQKPVAEDVPAAFQEFEAAARREISPEEPDDFWRVVGSEVLVEEDPRAALSRRVVLSPESITGAEIARAVRSGWVGGRSWVRLLEGQPAGEWRDLALGAATMDLEDPRACPLLKPLAGKSGEAAGHAAFLLGSRAQQEGNDAEAGKYFRDTLERMPRHLHARRSLHQILIGLGDPDAAAGLWRGIAQDQDGSDIARFARAQAAFLKKRWNEARAELADPMHSIAEGAPGPWLLRREIELAEALEACLSGRLEDAMIHLAAACRFMPQFGVGRYETSANGDMMYYRWRVAHKAGAELQASSLAAHALRMRPPAGSADAAYLARLAAAIQDPSAPGRESVLTAWEADAEPEWVQLLPLRAAVRRNSVAGWRALENDPLYRYRAQLELALGPEPTGSGG